MSVSASKKSRNVYQLRLLGLVSLLILAAFLVGSLIYVYFEGLLDRQTYQFYSLSLQNAVDAESAIRDSIKEVFDQMTFDNQLSSLFNYKTRSASDLLSGLKRLNAYTYANSFVDSIYLYNALDGTFYISSEHTSQAVQKSNELFDHSLADIVKQYWLYDNMEPISRQVTVSYPKIETLFYVTYLRYNTLAPHGESSVAVINVPQSMFQRQISLSPEADSTRVEVIDDQGILQLGMGRPEPRTDISGRQYVPDVLESKAEKGYFKTVYDNRAEIIFYQRTSGGYWTLIYAVGEQEIAALFSLPQKTATVFLLIACLALLLALIALLIRRMIADYKRQMAGLERAQEDQRLLREQQRRQMLLNLLSSSQVLSPLELERALREAGTSPLPGKPFHLALFILDGYDAYCQNSNHQDVAAAKRSVCAIVKEALAWQNVLFAVALDMGQVAVLVQPDGEQSLLASAAQARDCVLGSLNISLSLLLSKPFADLRELSAIYRWAQDALCYKQLFGKGCVMTWQEIQERELADIHLPEAKLKALVSSIMSLDMDKAMDEVKALLREIRKGSYRSFHIALIQLLAAMDDTLVLLLSNNSASASAQGNLQLYNIPRMESAREMGEALAACLQAAEKAVIDKKSSKHDDLMGRIEECVAREFADREFSAATVSEKTGLSSTYLSRLYKKYRGITLTEAIWEKRMEKARFLLESTEMQVTVIAEQCGFSEGPYFYKAFKKAHGVTPIAYRLNRRTSSGQP